MPPATAGRCRSRRFTGPTLIANKDREIARLEAAYIATLERYNVALVKSRAVLEDAHTVRLATGASVQGENDPDRDRRLAAYGTEYPRRRARDLVERSLSSATNCRSAS